MDILRLLVSCFQKSTSENDEESLLLIKDEGKTSKNKNHQKSTSLEAEASQNTEEKHVKIYLKSTPKPKPTVTQAVTGSLDIIKGFYAKMFSNTTCLDKIILICGIFFSFMHGVTFPFVAVLFGSLTNAYIQQAIHGYANQSSSSNYSTAGLYHRTAGLYHRTTDLLNIPDMTPIVFPNTTQMGIPNEVAKTFDIISQIVLQTFNEKQVQTKDQFTHYVYSTGILFILLASVILITSFLQALCWELMSLNQMYRLRKSTIHTILNKNMTWFSQHHTSEIVSDIFSEVEQIRNGTGFKFGSLIEYFSMCVVSAIIALLTSWRIATIFLTPTPFILFKILTFGKTLASESSEGTTKWTEAQKIATEVLETIDTVFAYGEQENEINRYGGKIEESIDVAIKQHHLSSVGNALLTVLVYGASAAAFWYSCKLLMQHSVTPGEIYTIFLSITMSTIGIKNILKLIPSVSCAYESGNRLGRYTEAITDSSSANDSDQPLLLREWTNGDIEFKNVNFSYPGGKEVLKNLSFKIQAGQSVAIISEAGEGKTTIANLLLRLYEPTNDNAEITINNVNINQLNLDDLRKHVGISLQKLYFNEKDEEIIDVIRAGRSNITDQEIKCLARILGPIPLYFDTHFQDELQNATTICKNSPRDLQRLVDLARSLIGDPSILILDECFAELTDYESMVFREQVLTKREGKTTIFLTHDPLPVEGFDKIYILKEGQILEQNIGTHEELMRREDSFYASMIKAESTSKELKIKILLTIQPRSIGTRKEHKRGEPLSLLQLIWNLITLEASKMWKIGFVGCVIIGIGIALFSFYFVEMFGTFSKSGPELADDGVFWAGMLILLALLSALGVWLRNLYVTSAGLYLLLGFEIMSFTTVLRRPKIYYQNSDMTPTALATQMMRNCSFIKPVLEFQVPEGISTIVTLFPIGTIITVLVWQIGIIAIFGVLPILILLAVILFKYKRQGRYIISAADTDSSKTIQEALNNIVLTQAYCLQKSCIDKYSKDARIAMKEAGKQLLTFSLIYACCETLFFIFCGSSFLYGSYLIQVDAIEPQSLFKIFFSTSFCFTLFSQIVTFMPDVADAVVALEQMNDLIQAESEVDSSLDALNDEGEPLLAVEGRLQFENASFKFSRSEFQVLNKINLTIPAGSSIGFTGRSPFGGTTILQLIQRFYDFDDGALYLDGAEKENSITKYKVGHLRKHIGWVPQNITFLDGSLADLLKYGCGNKEEITNDQILKTLSQVHLLHKFEKDFEEFKIKDYWNGLPHGRKVLIAIARAVSRNPNILLLDAPTDSLSDAEERVVLDVIKEVKKNRTCVIVSTIPSTLSLVDKIVVIENGKVLEEGTEDELLAGNGYFADCVSRLKMID